MVQSDKWILNRLNYSGNDVKVFRLNEGETTIGRNRAADVTTTSGICSRNHCVIDLTPDGKITITNKVCNRL